MYSRINKYNVNIIDKQLVIIYTFISKITGIKDSQQIKEYMIKEIESLDIKWWIKNIIVKQKK